MGHRFRRYGASGNCRCATALIVCVTFPGLERPGYRRLAATRQRSCALRAEMRGGGFADQGLKAPGYGRAPSRAEIEPRGSGTAEWVGALVAKGPERPTF